MRKGKEGFGRSSPFCLHSFYRHQKDPIALALYICGDWGVPLIVNEVTCCEIKKMLHQHMYLSLIYYCLLLSWCVYVWEGRERILPTTNN
jgi:hypothetical protein